MIPRPGLIFPWLLVAGGSLALAQEPTPPPSNPAVPAASTQPARFVDPYLPNLGAAKPDPEETPTPYVSPRRAPRTRTAPDPHDSAYRQNSSSSSSFGFRNPGGVGRNAEFYPPGNNFNSGGTDPIGVAHFGGGPSSTSRQSQLQSQQVGIQRQNEYDNRINALARPLGGFGAGFGFGYGFGGFPY